MKYVVIDSMVSFLIRSKNEIYHYKMLLCNAYGKLQHCVDVSDWIVQVCREVEGICIRLI